MKLTLVLFLVLSVLIGLGVGEWFFRLYMKALPPMAQSEFNTSASRIAHLMYGAGLGLVLFLWWLLGMAAANILRKKPAPGA